MGDDAIIGTYECVYCNLTKARHGGLDEDKKRVSTQLSATVCIAVFYKNDVLQVAMETPTQIIQLRDEDCLMGQDARYLQDKENDYVMGKKMVEDIG